MDTTDTVFLFTYAAAGAVEGEDKGRFVAVLGIRIGEREDTFALIEDFLIGDVISDRAADVAEVIEFYGKEDIFFFRVTGDLFTGSGTRNYCFSDFHSYILSRVEFKGGVKKASRTNTP